MATVDPILLRIYDYGVIAPLAAQDPVWTDVPVQSLAPHAYAAQSHLFPCLYASAELTDDQRVAICEAQQGWSRTHDSPFIGLLINAKRAIRPRLTRALVIKRRGQTDRLLRYYDPRVYQHLRWMLTAEQRTWLMEPATAWAWPDRQGNWQVDAPPNMANDARVPDYDTAQLARFGRIEHIERAYRRLSTQAPQTVANEQQAVERLDGILAQAVQQYEITADRDLDLYVDHVMTVHPRIHAHPDMASRLANVIGGQSYRGACRGLDNQTLARYARELSDPGRAARATAVHQ